MSQGKPNWRSLTWLGGALLILFVLAYWVELRVKPASEERETNNKRAFALADSDSYKSVAIHMGVRSIALECQDKCKIAESAQWKVTAPDPGDADQANCNNVVSSIKGLVASEVVDLSTESAQKQEELLAQYGLDPRSRKLPDQRRIEITTAAGGTQVAYFGTNHPIGDKFYVGLERGGKFDTTRVLLVAAYQKGSFEREPAHFRNRKLLSVQNGEVERLRLELPKGTVEVFRNPQGWSLLTRGEHGVADTENVETLISTLTYLTAKTFAAGNKSSAEGARLINAARRSGRVAITLKDKTTREINFYSLPPKKIVATVSSLDPLFELESGSFERLQKTPDDLRMSKLISPMEQFAMTRLGVGALKLERKDGKWRADGKDIAQDQVQKLLSGLSTKKIKSFLNAAPKGQEQGIQITLGDDTTADKKSYVFWKSGKDLFARDLKDSKGGNAFMIDASLIESLPFAQDFFQPKVPAPTPSAS